MRRGERWERACEDEPTTERKGAAPGQEEEF